MPSASGQRRPANSRGHLVPISPSWARERSCANREPDFRLVCMGNGKDARASMRSEEVGDGQDKTLDFAGRRKRGEGGMGR
jgi:hypothetical protein